MEDRHFYDDPVSLVEAAGHRPAERRSQRVAPHQGRTRSLPREETLARLERQIRELAIDHPQLVPGLPGGEPEDVFGKFQRLVEQRECLLRKIGATRVTAGYAFEYRRNRRAYRF